MNSEILDKITRIDYQAVTRSIEKFLLDAVEENHSDGIVFGLSGGIDSAVIAHLCSRVIKEDTLAVIMPDTDITPATETADALKIARQTGINHKTLDIKPIVNQYLRHLEPDPKTVGNLRARIRTTILYYYANAKNYLVLGSSDKSEYLIGYFTKFGDGASDLTPIISLYKLQVREIAKFLKIPQSIISKKSSPHLWKGHTAEAEIGATYEEIDAILYCFEKNMSIDQTAKTTGIDKNIVQKIHLACVQSHHKRVAPLGPELTDL